MPVKIKRFVADFETTTDTNDCRVWAYGICGIGEPYDFQYGNNIEDFMKWCAGKENYIVAFHNLKFDGAFILGYLNANGFKHIVNNEDKADKTYETLISNMGAYYSMTVYFTVNGKKVNKVTFIDSMKIFNTSVEKLAQDFDLPIRKGSIDYKANREVGHILTDEEVSYLRNDVEIVARALDIFYNTTGFKKLQNALGTSGLQIKGQLGFVDYNSGWGWNGNLETTSVKEMYMIQTSEQVELVLTGKLADPATKITLQKGWTYIGYPVTTAMNVETAFGINPQDGDIIKTHNGVAMYYKDLETANGGLWSGWDGSLKSLTPGVGYMYKNTSGEVKTLVYPTPNANTRAEVRANVTAENNHWAPKASAFANNMNIIAVLESNDMMGEFEVAAFVNGEVRGSARPTYVEPIDAYVLFMTIYGEEGEEMTFKYYDIYSDEEHSINNTLTYSDDAVIGSIREPYMFFANTLGMDENAASTLSIYPNPTTTNAAISFETTFDMVEVFNSLGAKVAEYRNVDRIEGIEAAGVYVIRVTNDSAVQNCRLIVK